MSAFKHARTLSHIEKTRSIEYCTKFPLCDISLPSIPYLPLDPQVQFSYCICDQALGYRGYGCTELGPNAPSQLVLILNVVFLIGSNIAFVGAIVISIRLAYGKMMAFTPLAQ